jgi:hypothetical protein
MDVDGGSVERLTNDAWVKDAPLQSARDGSIVFTVNDREHFSLAFVVPPDSAVAFLVRAPFNCMDPTFDATGSHILFVADRDGNREVYRIPTAGGELTRLTWNNVDDHTPAATGTDEEILLSKKGGIYLYSLQGNKETMLSFKGDSAPHWHR